MGFFKDKSIQFHDGKMLLKRMVTEPVNLQHFAICVPRKKAVFFLTTEAESIVT